MIPGSWLTKEIPNSCFTGIIAGGCIGIVVVTIWLWFSMGFSTAQCGLPPMDIMVMKLSPDGTMQWQTRIDSGEDDRAFAIVQNPDGGYAIAGRNDIQRNPPAGRLIFLNSSGAIVRDRWYPEYKGGFSGFFPGPAGGFIAGTMYPGKILILDAEGTVTREIPYADYDYASYSAPGSGDGFFVLAENLSGRNATLILLGPDGSERWRHEAIPAIATNERSLLPTSDGGCLVVGYADDVRELNYFRYDSSGNERWNLTLGTSPDNRPVLMAEVRPGTFGIVYESAKYSDTTPSSTMETFSVMVDDNGTLLKERMPAVSAPWRLPAPAGWDWVLQKVPTRDGGSIVLGSARQREEVLSCL